MKHSIKKSDISYENTLQKEEFRLNDKELRKLLSDRWIDVFYPSKYSVVKSNALPSFVDDLLADKSRVDRTVSIHNAGGRLCVHQPGRDDIDVRVFEDNIFVNVASAGTWARVPGERVRVLGSTKFSRCTAIAGKNDLGDLCLAHIPGPGHLEVKRVAKKILEKKFGPGKYVMISPKRMLIDDATEDQIKIAEEANKSFEKLASSLKLPHYTFTEMFPSEESLFNDLRMCYAITLSQSGLRACVRAFDPNEPTNLSYPEAPEVDVEF